MSLTDTFRRNRNRRTHVAIIDIDGHAIEVTAGSDEELEARIAELLDLPDGCEPADIPESASVS